MTDGPAVVPGDPLDPERFALMTRSHELLVGRPLVPEDAGAAWLYGEAPFGVLAHDGGEDPRFFYANVAAQTRFEYSWAQFAGLPSRLSAGPEDRAERQRLLEAVGRDGFIDDYRGLRVSRTGRSFWIEDATVWNLLDERGARVGQAARFAL